MASNVGSFCVVQNLKVCGPILPFDAQNRTQALHMKMFRQFNVPSMQSPGLTLIKKAGKDICLVNFELGGLLDVVLIEHTSSQSFQSLTCFADPDVDLFVKGAIIGNDISEVHEFLQPSVLEMDGWWFVVGGLGTSVFPTLIVRKSRWDALANLLTMSWKADSMCPMRAQSLAKRASRMNFSIILVVTLR